MKTALRKPVLTFWWRTKSGSRWRCCIEIIPSALFLYSKRNSGSSQSRARPRRDWRGRAGTHLSA